jgi:dephospho-CoA kinase
VSNFVVGLTGGIGSGKTAVSDRFKHHGIIVVDADIISREVVQVGSHCLTEISRHFGKNILLADGNLNRAALRERIFSNPEDKQWLEALLHPAIAEETINQIAAASSEYTIFVSPLLIEGGQNALCHRLLVVDVPVDIQVERTTTRDNNPEDQVRRIIASQASREQRQAKADDILLNNKSLEELHGAVDKLHQQYLKLAKNFEGQLV